MRSAMSEATNILLSTPTHSTHDLSSTHLTTGTFGNLMPTFFQETVPGDRITIRPQVLCRFMPLASPVFHRMELVNHYYFVPNRILWDNWTNFISGKKDPLTDEHPVHPFFERSELTVGAPSGQVEPLIASYFGFVASDSPSSPSAKLNPFPFAAYQAICNYYYRHRVVQDEYPFKLQDGALTGTPFQELTATRVITYGEDYFNAALPTPQQDNPAFVDSDGAVFRNTSGGVTNIDAIDGVDPLVIQQQLAVSSDGNQVDEDAIFARVRITVEEIRRAVALQDFLEKNLHGLTYDDFIKVHYGVDIEDYRVQQPEYIGGFRQPVVVSDVMNQSDDFQGRITGNAATFGSSDSFSYQAKEHGIIIGITSVTYEPIYINSLQKLLTKGASRFEYFFPEFDNLGEQPIKHLELYGNSVTPNDTFGYVPRYFDYRKSFSLVTRHFRNDLLHWHLGRNLAIGGSGGLTSDFYNVLDERRIFTIVDEDFDPLLLQIYNSVVATRPMGRLPRPATF